MPTKIEKLEAHASHLLDAFISLRERYAMLDPMLFNEDVCKQHGSGRQALGFKILRHSLFLSCAQDIANLSMDDDKEERAPSLLNLVRALTDDAIRNTLRERYSLLCIHSVEETDPAIVAALRDIEAQKKGERRMRFDELYCELTEAWAILSTNLAMKKFRDIRDKVSAHIEVRYKAGKYQFVDIGDLDIKFADLRIFIDAMQKLVELVGLLVCNGAFAWATLDEHLTEAGTEFWVRTGEAC